MFGVTVQSEDPRQPEGTLREVGKASPLRQVEVLSEQWMGDKHQSY